MDTIAIWHCYMSLLFPSPSLCDAWFPALRPWPILLTGLIDVISMTNEGAAETLVPSTTVRGRADGAGSRAID